MKKLVLLLSLAFSLNAFSQIEKPITKGNMMLSGGGTIYYSKINNENPSGNSESSLFNISLTPGLSYFIIDNLAIGLNATISYDGTKNNKMYTLGVGPMIKYYFSNGFFLNAEVGYNHLEGISNTSVAANYFSFKPGLGYAFFLNQKVSLEPGLSYEFHKNNYKNLYSPLIQKANTIMLELKLNIFL